MALSLVTIRSSSEAINKVESFVRSGSLTLPMVMPPKNDTFTEPDGIFALIISVSVSSCRVFAPLMKANEFASSILSSGSDRKKSKSTETRCPR